MGWGIMDWGDNGDNKHGHGHGHEHRNKRREEGGRRGRQQREESDREASWLT